MEIINSKKWQVPFPHYTFENFFTQEESQNYCDIDLHMEGNQLTKTRTSSKTRIYLNEELCSKYPIYEQLRRYFLDSDTIKLFEKLSGSSMPKYLRIETIKDTGVSWLEPHCDISEKKLSLLIFINDVDESTSLGTDLYDDCKTLIKTVPYIHNTGYFFFPGENTWHGLEKKEIKKHRRMIMVNYVTFPTEIVIPESCEI